MSSIHSTLYSGTTTRSGLNYILMYACYTIIVFIAQPEESLSIHWSCPAFV